METHRASGRIIVKGDGLNKLCHSCHCFVYLSKVYSMILSGTGYFGPVPDADKIYFNKIMLTKKLFCTVLR